MCRQPAPLVSSLTRMLSVLDLFSRDHTTMTAEQIAEALALTRTTCYRYTRELSLAGLLVSHDGQFMLGPRIIELDHRMVQADPLINVGGPVINALAVAVGATGLLTTTYNDKVVNVYSYSGSSQPLPMSFGRGTTMPTFRSSTSKMLLAMMSRGRLQRLFNKHAQDPDCQAIGSTWLDFWRALQEIRQQGYAVSLGELNRGLAGLSVPVSYGSGELAGCMSLIFARAQFNRFDVAVLAPRLVAAADQIARSLSSVAGR